MIRSHSHVGSGPRPVPRPLPSEALLLWAEEGEGLDSGREGTACLGYCSVHVRRTQPWCRSSLGVDYLLGQPGHVTSPEDTSEIKGIVPRALA